MKIIYRGYIIEEETDFWALKFGFAFRFYKSEVIKHAYSVKDAQSEIDEILATR